MFFPKEIYYEENIQNYSLGKFLLDKYKDVPKSIIANHNNIPEMRSKENSEFPKMKQNLIIATRKIHKHVENHKVSNLLVSYTSSGCTASCMYCYLVCNYNKCSYLRIFVNREQMLDKIIKTANSCEKNLTFEIGSNSDLVLENTITNNLVWTIENFAASNKGYLTFPTKFDMVDPILNLNGKDRIIVRMSINPSEIINKIEFGTSRLEQRILALNKLHRAGYKVGILIAPIVLLDNWKELYKNLLQILSDSLDSSLKKCVFFELIFMTHSYIHKMINQEAFPNAINLYNQDLMTGRGRGKYMYKINVKNEAKNDIIELMKKYFPNNEILYIV